MTSLKYNAMNDQLVEYLHQHHSFVDDPVLDELRQRTREQFPDDAEMQVSPIQGSFLTTLVRLLGVRNALEIGTFTGHSSICIARGLPDDGRLLCMDMSEPWTTVAREFWGKAGVEQKISLQLGDALSSIEELDSDQRFDLVHIDAEKTLYEAFFETALPFVNPNGLIVFDNMLWGGRVVEADVDDRTAAIQQLNRRLIADSRVETVLLPIGDGIQFCRKK